MMRVRSIISGFVLLALGSGSLAQSTNELTDKQKREFETAVVSKTCTGRSVDFPDYPFSVERLERVIRINKRPAEKVRVLVIDNGFLGYRYAPTDDAGPSYFETTNYPVEFFEVLNRRGFSPFLDEEDAMLRPAGDDEMNGHGTHISGIILGGRYQAGTPTSGENLTVPNVRRLLLEDATATHLKSWLKIRIAPLGWGSRGAQRDPVEKLANALKSRETAETRIVNISLARNMTSYPSLYTLPSLDPSVLVVLAAGNATMHLEPSVMSLPTKLQKSEQLLLVGSHDADGTLSHFSNYGDRVVLAAPGCQIESWESGDGASQPLSGTSMSTAVVSFAAALVRSQWPNAMGAALRHRLIVSAKFEPRLSQCGRAKALTKRAYDPQECIDHGARLDIEAAALVSQDLIEFERCDGRNAKACTRYTAIGTLQAVPESLVDCMEERPAPRQGQGVLTYNAAIKRVGDGRFDIVTEEGQQVGTQPLKWDSCLVSETGLTERIQFRAEGTQLDGTNSNSKIIPIEVKDLIRVVTRAL